MSSAVTRFGGILIAGLLCACGESKTSTPNPGTAGTAGMAGVCSDAITATADQNYAFTSTITLPPVSVKPDSELFFEWGGVTKDLLDHPVDPMTSVDQIELVLWALTQGALEVDLNADALEMRDVAIIASIATNKAMTSASLFEFTSVGMPLTPEEILPYVNAMNYPPTENIYTAIIASGTVLGQGTLMMQSFVLDPASSNTTVTISDASIDLIWDATLTELSSPEVHPGTPSITIDWTSMTINASGYPFKPKDVTEVLVARYDETPEELEAEFLDLELIAEDLYRGEVLAGTTFDLSTLTNGSGAPFPGIDDDGTWILALVCGECANPAPWYLTILEPCAS